MIGNRVTIFLALLISSAISCSKIEQDDNKLGRTRFLLLDSTLIAEKVNAKLVLGTIKKHPKNPVFGETEPWEIRFDNLYGNVIYDDQDELYKCWYSPFIVDYSANDMSLQQRKSKKWGAPNNREMGVCYAKSKDGINWVKPDLGLVDYKGSKQNNIIWRGPHGSGIHKDRFDPDPIRRYKTIFKEPGFGSDKRMMVSFSEDGLNWSEPQNCEGVEVAGDTHNNAFWAPTLGKYVCITRTRGELGREVARIESDDFVNWTKEEVVMQGEDKNLQPYAMPAFYHGGVYLGLVAIHNQETDRVHTELAWSSDTKDWNRIAPKTPFIPNSENELDYDYGCVYACATPVFMEDEIRIYYGGSDWLHTNWRNGNLSLATLRPDGFAGYVQEDKSNVGIIETKTFNYNGGSIELTADVEKGGSIKVAVLSDGKEIAISKSITETITDRSLQFNNKIKEKDINLKIEIKNATVYSFNIE